MKKKVWEIFLNSIPNLIMIGLIPIIKNDYILTLVYIGIIVLLLFFIECTKKDLITFLFGFIVITFFEYIFVSTGVEIFIRNSLFGIMPLWLPFLWAYGFVAIKRSLEILNNYE